ncbi:hypothetical protein [Sorangium sp. So ce388]|uniref:hypothetical protein n=1 Tax=Sorangium sp. So ce388 TaxID=3133309 RepID=UPI003F5B499E
MSLNNLANEADRLNMPELAWVFRTMAGTDYAAHQDRLRGDYAQLLDSARCMHAHGTEETATLYERAAAALRALGAEQAWKQWHAAE